jgi:hypothetical protein
MRIGDLESILAAQRVGEADEISGAIHTAWGRFSPEWATSRAGSRWKREIPAAHREFRAIWRFLDFEQIHLCVECLRIGWASRGIEVPFGASRDQGIDHPLRY